jgi:hexokinase
MRKVDKFSFPYRFGVASLKDLKEDFREELIHVLKTWGKNISYIPDFIARTHERSKYGVSLYDVFDLDMYLATMLLNAFEVMSENCYSLPMNMTGEQWAAVLKEIKDCLSVFVEESEAIDTDYPRKKEAINRALDLIKQHYGDFWI